MVKILSSSASKMFRNSEQYGDCSTLLMKEDDPPLEELDPAILSCGLPAIVLSDMRPMYRPRIHYSMGQLQNIKNSSLCSRRPAAADDPKVSAFAIWRTDPIHSNRRGNRTVTQPHKNDQEDHDSGNSGKEKSPEQIGKFRNHGRENGFVGPRYRRNYEFSNSNHHVIVKSYRSDNDYHHLQNTIIEEEPEWMSAGPTSRLDTIELRGFDDDLSVSQTSSGKTSISGDGKNSSKGSGKHIAFYDELHHYEHVHPKKTGGGILKQHDLSAREGDIESVTTSNTGSPPPARSTPTKNMTMTEFNNMMEDAQRHNSGVNVNNFEDYMKFDSLLGSDTPQGSIAPSGSRFSKWFRRGGNSFNTSGGSSYDGRRHSFHSPADNIASTQNYRYPFDRNYPQQYASRCTSYPGFSGDMSNDSNSAFKRLVDMMAQTRVNNNLAAQQQQYLMQMLNKNQQSEILRRMLIKNTVDNASDANQQQTTQTPRVPTQLELQLHTQSIMQNALLRKKLQDQRKMIFEQNSQIVDMAISSGKSKPNAEVQQFVKSVSPNIQRSLSLLNQTTDNGVGGNQYRSYNQTFTGGNVTMNNMAFNGGPHQQDLSASLRQLLLPQYQQQGQRPFGNRRRYEKRSVTWKHPN